MSSEFELVDISNKRRASSSPLDASVGPDLVPLGTTNPENFRESTGASWAWAASGMFVVRLSLDVGNLTILIQLVIMVVCPHILATHAALRHWPISSNINAAGVLLGVAFRPSIGIFGRRPRCQCDLVSSTWDYPPPESNVQIPSAATASAVPERNKEPPAHPLIVPVVSFSLLSAFLSYNTAGAGSLPLFYSACMGLLGIWGLWVVSVAVLKHELARDRNPDLWRWGTTQRSYLQVHEWFLEKLEPTSTRVLSYSATNLLRQNRRSDGNESKRRTVDTLTTLDLCIGVVVRVVE